MFNILDEIKSLAGRGAAAAVPAPEPAVVEAPAASPAPELEIEAAPVAIIVPEPEVAAPEEVVSVSEVPVVELDEHGEDFRRPVDPAEESRTDLPQRSQRRIAF